MKIKQQGFALVEAMIGVVIFAISLVALVNYSQYIILNFNQLYMNSSAIRVLHSTLEKSVMSGEPISGEKNSSIGPNLRYPEWKMQTVRIPRVDNCTELMVSLTVKKQPFSLSRWYCSTGEHYVSSVSF
ncbi:TPA: prepilin-type N-terminal cleavage/methylation domain-containing protein [Providencia rettgeri]|uniref:prepilin-type N-terminal cleavage/methylation domain-containing protein n=1 Tax=Providencia TaxID=586 RepID=UPI001B372AAE|nr:MULTISPECIES: prepilin-type N-terminal cleavage/methylation domain-containing protein [Providencia]EMB5785952.1 prepilin-type N-terminal cleavage/methylation domain-containing protein [Providencia rettgeri]MBQ0365037.1 prepilin-type N-terminal cleavage/methylation domain-containing protein [Providencia rettgeri]HBC7429565.1 prepilin-type N-terminal cleavage/methylation domain-containing protein [Providencia rettgeri]